MASLRNASTSVLRSALRSTSAAARPAAVTARATFTTTPSKRSDALFVHRDSSYK